jgi:hypothetical protein
VSTRIPIRVAVAAASFITAAAFFAIAFLPGRTVKAVERDNRNDVLPTVSGFMCFANRAMRYGFSMRQLMQ